MQKLTKPSYLKELCHTYNLTPSKKYGQNYLVTESVIEKMIGAADVGNKDTVIEIGPGFGVLTFALAEHAKQVYAFEIEKKLERYWEEHKAKNLEIIWGNALQKISNFKFQISNYKVVANLPYQITSHVLRTLLELENKPTSITVMVQKEVAERMVAKPGDMSILSVSVQYYGDVSVVCKVPAGNFWPSPKVDSAVVHIGLKKQETCLPAGRARNKFTDDQFFRVVRAGFHNKRKQLWRNLYTELGMGQDDIKAVLTDVTGNEKIRAEELSIDQWISLTKKLQGTL